MMTGKVRENETLMPAMVMLLLVPVACGPKTAGEPRTASEAPVPEAGAGQDETGAAQEQPDPTDPENLARAVFSALTLKDATAYKALVPNSAGDAQELAQTMGQTKVMTDDEIAAMLEKQAKKFSDFIALLESKGFNLADAVMTDIDAHRAQVRDGMGFAEDIKFTMEAGGKRAIITIDDCMLFKRGWLILDGLKLRDPVEGP